MKLKESEKIMGKLFSFSNFPKFQKLRNRFWYKPTKMFMINDQYFQNYSNILSNFWHAIKYI